MLSADLVRVAIRNGVLTVRYVDHDDAALLSLAESLCGLWETNVGERRGTLDEAVRALEGDKTHFLVVRGLAKLLDDRSTWETVADVEPRLVRQAVFEAAFAARPVTTRADAAGTPRADVIAAAAAKLGMAPEAVDAALYADLKSEQRLIAHDAFDAPRLLARYNVALAQGVLLRARELRLRVEVDRPARLRALYRIMKFHQLIHRTRRVEAGWEIVVDGPLSLFESSSRYGVQLAMLLPSVLHLDAWSIEADVDWRGNGNTQTFRLTPGDGLRPHGRLTGAWATEQEETLLRRLREAHEAGESRWAPDASSEVVELGGDDVFVPDFTLRRADGAAVHVELIGYWRRRYLERKAELLRAQAVRNVVLCVSKRLAAEKADDLEGLRVVSYAAVVPLRALLAAADEAAG